MKANKFFIVILLAVFFGLAGGIVGEIIARVYILESAFGIPLFGEINYDNKNSGPSLIIRQAQKVVVEQNTLITETGRAVANSIVGIYKKKDNKVGAIKGSSQILADGNYYELSQAIGQAFIITSDGWLITNFQPEETKKITDKQKITQAVSGAYVVITADKKIYPVDSAANDLMSGYSFWHIKATDLPVRKFVSQGEVVSGQSVFALNLNGWIWTSTILGDDQKNGALAQNSDNCQNKLALASAPVADFKGSFLFDFSGSLIGIISSGNSIVPLYDYEIAIGGLIKNKTISRPALGVNYINLSGIASTDKNLTQGALITKDEKGLAIEKGSVAEKAGLRDGDIILSFNNIILDKDNDLCGLVRQLKPGAETNLVYTRTSEKKEIKIILDQQ